MILTWVFRALFVPLLVLAIITSSCSVAEAADVAGSELALVTRIPLDDAFGLAARLGIHWRGASKYWTSTRSRSGFDLPFDFL